MKFIGGGYLLLIFLILFFTSIPLSVKSFDGGLVFPDSKGVESQLPISLFLGESWSNKDGKSYIGHLGEDFVGDAGTSIYSISDGIVVKRIDWPACPRSKNHGWGPVLIVKYYTEKPYFFNSENTILSKGTKESPSEIFVQYSHLQNISVIENESIYIGQKLAEVGNVCPYIPHLHFEIKDEDAFSKDINLNGGPGTGYSGTNNFAPNRYKPSEFIKANKKVVSNKQAPPQPQPQKTNQPFSLKEFLKKLAPEKLIQLLKDIINPKVEAEQNQKITSNEQLANNKEQETINKIPLEKEIYTLQIQNKNQQITSVPNQQINIKLLVTNTGNTTWKKSQISTNVVGGIEPNKQYHHPTWLTSLRPGTLDQSKLDPKEQGSFSFIINSPKEIGTHTFRVQIVRQENSTFKSIEPDIATITINVQTEENKTKNQPSSTNQISPPAPPQNTFPKIVDNVKNVIENIEEKTENIIDNIIDFIQNNPLGHFPFPIGGSSPKQEENHEVINKEDEENTRDQEEVLQIPEIKITSPTTTKFTTTEKTITINGTHNSSTTHIYLNGFPTTTLIINTSTWSIPLTLESNTNTYQFIGYNEEKTEQTPTTTITITKKEIPIILSVPIITTPSTSEFFTSSTTIMIGGTKENSADSVLIYINENTLTASTTTSTWESSVELDQGENIISAIATDNKNNKSTSNTIKITLDNQAPTITEITSQIDENNITLFYNATDNQSQVENYTIQFWFPEDNRGPDEVCAEENNNNFLPANSPLLQDVDDLIETLIEKPCTWFTLETDSSSTTFSFQEEVAIFPLYFRVKSKDTLGNISSFLYSKEIIIVESEIQEDDFVVISEIAWMGTGASVNDEWIELYNPTFHDIKLNNWKLVWGEKEGEAYSQNIDLSNLIIPAGGYIVLERTDQNTISDYETLGGIYTGNLGNGGEHIILFDQNNNIIDEVNAEEGWFAGNNTTKESMTRQNPVISGNISTNWCTYSTCPITLQISDPNEVKHDAEGTAISGTPGGPPPLVVFLEL